MIYPDFFARFYDLIYHSLRADVDSGFFLKKISEAQGPVLEIGVGTGRFFIDAINQGADMYGIDISPSMTDVLKSKLPETHHHRVWVANAVNFKTNRRFRLIIAPFRVFMHLMTPEEQLACLDNVYHHLENNGLFIFDAYIPNPKMLAEGFDHFVDFEGEYEPGLKMRRIVTNHNDVVNQINDITFRFEWENKKHKWQNKEWKTQLHFFFRYEMEHLLKLSPFKKFIIFGDYAESPLNSNSKDFVVVCRK